MEFEQDEEQTCSDSFGSSKKQMYERDSDFGDQNCGEPLLPQRLLIEFTPDDELDLDSEYNQKKCRAFWDFIKSKPELQHLMAVPEVVDYGESVTSSGYQPSESMSESHGPIDRTAAGAVSALELAQKKGQMVPVFLGMDPQSHCSLGSREYPESVITINKAKKKPYVCACKGSCEVCRRKKGRTRVPASNAVAVDLCKKIDKWDAEHPKSMEPPGHSPNLCSARRKL